LLLATRSLASPPASLLLCSQTTRRRFKVVSAKKIAGLCASSDAAAAVTAAVVKTRPLLKEWLAAKLSSKPGASPTQAGAKAAKHVDAMDDFRV